MLSILKKIGKKICDEKIILFGIILVIIPLFATAKIKTVKADTDVDVGKSFYMMTSAASAYFSVSQEPSAKGAGALKNVTIGDAGGVIGYADSDTPGFSDFIMNKITGAAVTRSYKSLINVTTKKAEANSKSTNSLYYYARYGYLLNATGLDNTGGENNPVRWISGYLLLLVYDLSQTIPALFLMVIDILKQLNVFRMFADAFNTVVAGASESTNGVAKGAKYMTMEGGELYGNTNPFSSVISYLNGMYRALYSWGWEITIPICLCGLAAGILLLREDPRKRNSRIKNLFVRAILITFGVPICGALYTTSLDLVESAVSDGVDGTSTVVASILCDFEGWAQKGRLEVPAGAVLESAGSKGTLAGVPSGKTYSNLRNTCFIINEFVGHKASKFKTGAEQIDWNSNSLSKTTKPVDNKETVQDMHELITRYAKGDYYESASFESETKAWISKTSEKDAKYGEAMDEVITYSLQAKYFYSGSGNTAPAGEIQEAAKKRFNGCTRWGNVTKDKDYSKTQTTTDGNTAVAGGSAIEANINPTPIVVTQKPVTTPKSTQKPKTSQKPKSTQKPKTSQKPKAKATATPKPKKNSKHAISKKEFVLLKKKNPVKATATPKPKDKVSPSSSPNTNNKKSDTDNNTTSNSEENQKLLIEKQNIKISIQTLKANIKHIKDGTYGGTDTQEELEAKLAKSEARLAEIEGKLTPYIKTTTGSAIGSATGKSANLWNNGGIYAKASNSKIGSKNATCRLAKLTTLKEEELQKADNTVTYSAAENSEMLSKKNGASVDLKGGLSTMAMYNYLNTEFTKSEIKTYSVSKTTSSFTKKAHYSVNLIGGGLLGTLYWVNAMVLLLSMTVLAIGYAFSILVNSFKISIEVICNVPLMLLGVLRGGVRVLIFTMVLIIELVGTMFLYSVVSDLILAMGSVVDSSMSDQLGETILLGINASIAPVAAVGTASALKDSLILVIVKLILSTAIIILLTIKALQVRTGFIRSLNEMMQQALERLLLEGAPTGTVQGLQGNTGGGVIGSGLKGIAKGIGMGQGGSGKKKIDGLNQPPQGFYNGDAENSIDLDGQDRQNHPGIEGDKDKTEALPGPTDENSSSTGGENSPNDPSSGDSREDDVKTLPDNAQQENADDNKDKELAEKMRNADSLKDVDTSQSHDNDGKDQQRNQRQGDQNSTRNKNGTSAVKEQNKQSGKKETTGSTKERRKGNSNGSRNSNQNDISAPSGVSPSKKVQGQSDTSSTSNVSSSKSVQSQRGSQEKNEGISKGDTQGNENIQSKLPKPVKDAVNTTKKIAEMANQSAKNHSYKENRLKAAAKYDKKAALSDGVVRNNKTGRFENYRNKGRDIRAFKDVGAAFDAMNAQQTGHVNLNGCRARIKGNDIIITKEMKEGGNTQFVVDRNTRQVKSQSYSQSYMEQRYSRKKQKEEK